MRGRLGPSQVRAERLVVKVPGCSVDTVLGEGVRPMVVVIGESDAEREASEEAATPSCWPVHFADAAPRSLA